jgi:hypothetical protein
MQYIIINVEKLIGFSWHKFKDIILGTYIILIIIHELYKLSEFILNIDKLVYQVNVFE